MQFVWGFPMNPLASFRSHTDMPPTGTLIGIIQKGLQL